ncbi:hypothetical protein [Ralstonia pseudosolanacearum]|uniref:hypothetical protein n=1 Tax=Ralstonia pseudosolanacearum TaxID=1310165 RepID=UPI001FFAABFB|nr:hypothetical protein [Ralstonia pseudosolanacearum]
MKKTPTNREQLVELRHRLGMTQTEVANFLEEKTMRPCKLRTVQAWESDPALGSARTTPDWAVKLLAKEAENRGC